MGEWECGRNASPGLGRLTSHILIDFSSLDARSFGHLSVSSNPENRLGWL